MTHRLYFVLPDVASARQMADDLLLARVEDRRMHFLAKRGTDLGALHKASYLQKTDIAHGASVGLVAGGGVGSRWVCCCCISRPAFNCNWLRC